MMDGSVVSVVVGGSATLSGIVGWGAAAVMGLRGGWLTSVTVGFGLLGAYLAWTR